MKLIGRVNRPVSLGEEILLDELEEIHGVELTDLDPNAGHLTYFRQRDRWHQGFDFRRNGRLSPRSSWTGRESFWIVRSGTGRPVPSRPCA